MVPTNEPTTGSISTTKTQYLSGFKLFMLAIVSVDSIRNLPITAQYGTSLVTFYLIAALAFFVPLIMVINRLAIRYPHTGGSYLWIEDAFGKQWGLVSIWLQWIYNVIWYPTIFAFISTTLATMISSNLEHSRLFILGSSLFFFWALTLINCRGIRTIGWMSTFYAITGTFLPMSLIIVLAIYWLLSGHSSATELSWSALIPKHDNLINLTFFINILFSLLGIDSIAIHAGNVKNPASTYPKVLGFSGLIIVSSLILSSLAICIVIEPEQIGLINGLMSAYQLFFNEYNLGWAVQFIGIAIILGGIGIASSWIIGLARGLHIAACASDAHVPQTFKTLNKHAMPVGILYLQGFVFTIISSLFILFPDINNAYWLLSSMTAQFALLYYVILFLAAIKLLNQPEKKPFLSLMILLGLITCIGGIFIGLIPPASIHGTWAILRYELIFVFGALLFLLPLSYFVLSGRTSEKK